MWNFRKGVVAGVAFGLALDVPYLIAPCLFRSPLVGRYITCDTFYSTYKSLDFCCKGFRNVTESVHRFRV